MDRILLKPLEAADMLGIGRSRVYDMLAAGELPSVRIGRSIRIPVAALQKWVERKQDGGDAEAGEIGAGRGK